MPFPPSAACRFFDLPPVNLQNLPLHLTKNSFASAPTHLCGIALSAALVRRCGSLAFFCRKRWQNPLYFWRKNIIIGMITFARMGTAARSFEASRGMVQARRSGAQSGSPRSETFRGAGGERPGSSRYRAREWTARACRQPWVVPRIDSIRPRKVLGRFLLGKRPGAGSLPSIDKGGSPHVQQGFYRPELRCP